MDSKTKKIKWVGIIFFFTGSIVAISSGAKMPEGAATFPDTLPSFFLGIILAVTGLIVWHLKQREIIKQTVAIQKAGGGESPIAILKGMVPKLIDLSARINNLSVEEICLDVDKILDNYVLPLAEVREDITNILGMSKGAEVLVTIAYGERMLNRVWSAASDGHADEARAVFPDAYSAFTEAVALVDKASAE